MRHLLAIRDLTPDELRTVLGLSSGWPHVLGTGEGVALYFEKPSARTRNSMEIAAAQLALHPVYLQPAELGIGTRESVEDVTRTLACYHRIIAARVFDHQLLEQMAAIDAAPVLNMLSGSDHPLQALADLMTLWETFGSLEGRVLAYVGDGNNVARSLAIVGTLAGMEVRVAAPEGFQLAEPHGAVLTDDAAEAAAGADALYTDVWVSMGDDESTAAARREALAPYRLDDALLDRAAPGAIALHCLPAHPGEEITEAVLYGSRQRIWDQAENRRHAQKALLELLVG